MPLFSSRSTMARARSNFLRVALLCGVLGSTAVAFGGCSDDEGATSSQSTASVTTGLTSGSGTFTPTRPISEITDNPIVFVVQVPIPSDFGNVMSSFGNHLPTPETAPRGGDLYIAYPDGTLRNLTLEAGFGNDGFQGSASIAVRDPLVHWDGNRIVFSMIVGATDEPFIVAETYWQLYEMTGLAKGETAVITKIANQPSDTNNVSPAYTSDDRILFTSDRSRTGERHLYPQRDEYEEAPTNSGVWLLDPAIGNLALLDHSPSGDFEPFVDSFGRVVFTRWDHLQRDQQKDLDYEKGGDCQYCVFNYDGEGANSQPLSNADEVFPEPRGDRLDLLAGTPFKGHEFNHFIPWMMNQDGTEHETLNHLGRHELHKFFFSSRNDDAMIQDYARGPLGETNQNSLEQMFQVSEDPNQAGRYIGVDAPVFGTHASGQVVAMVLPPGANPDDMVVEYITHRDTSDATDSPSADHTGFYRDPIMLTSGELISAHTNNSRNDKNQGSATAPESLYRYRLRVLKADGAYLSAESALTEGITKTVSFFADGTDQMVSYSGELWELQPVEVVARPRPSLTTSEIPSIEQTIFSDVGVDALALESYLRSNDLALVVSRDVTVRDDADRQQPFNLRVAGTSKQTVSPDGGTIYDVNYMQFFQGDLIRGLTQGTSAPIPGRRVLAQPMHDVPNPVGSGPPGSVPVAADGSMAAFVPARRALSWQLTGPSDEAVVIERNWITFQPGEVRVCASCHGLNSTSQSGNMEPINPPEALRDLLVYYRDVLQ